MKINNDELIVRNYPEIKQTIIQKQNFKPPNCPSCKQNNWLEFDKGYFCRNCEYIINKQKHQIDKNVLRQDEDFSIRLNYANKKIKETWINMNNTTYNTTEDMIKELQSLKGKTKLKFFKNISNHCDIVNIRFDAKNPQSINKIYHEVLLLKKILQT